MQPGPRKRFALSAFLLLYCLSGLADDAQAFAHGGHGPIAHVARLVRSVTG